MKDLTSGKVNGLQKLSNDNGPDKMVTIEEFANEHGLKFHIDCDNDLSFSKN